MAVPEGFQSFTQPRDTFVQQSTQAAINVTDPLTQVATALATIEPTLQKFILQKIEDKKEEEVAAGQSKGQQAGRVYTKTEKLLYPRNVEIDETSEEYAQSLVALRKNQKAIDVEITRGRSAWFKNAYQEAKAITLGKNFAVELEANYDTYRVPDSVTGEMKPLSAYPFQSPEVQNYISSFRNKNVEAANIEDFYFNRSFLPQIEKGVTKFATEHEKDHSYYKLEEYSKSLKENLGLTWTAYQLKKAKFGDKADMTAEANDIKLMVENVAKLYQAEDLAKIYDEVIIPWIMERGLLMASNDQIGAERFDIAREFLKEFTMLFPRKMKTETVINKKGEVEVKPVLRQVFEEDGSPTIDEKGKAVFEPEYFDQNVLQTKKNYEKKLNTALKAINTLEVQYQKTGKEKNQRADILEMKTLLKKGKEMTKEDKQRIKELASNSTAATTWLKNNRDTYNPNTVQSFNQLYKELRGGEIRDDKYAYVRINDWFDSTLKLDKDEANYKKLIEIVDDEANEEKKYAAAGAKAVVQSKSLLFNTLPDQTKNDPLLMDKLSDEIEKIVPYMIEYAETKRIFGEETKERYPTVEEIDQELERQKEVMDINLLAIQKFASEGTATNLSLDPFTPENKQKDKSINIERIKFVLRELNGKQSYVNGKKRKPTLEDLEDAYDYLGTDVSIEFLLGQYDAELDKNKLDSKIELAKLLDNLDLSFEDIEKYNLYDKFTEIGADITNNYADLTKVMEEYKVSKNIDQPPSPPTEDNAGANNPNLRLDGSGDRFDELNEEEKQQVNEMLGKEVFPKVQTPSTTNENVEKLDVSDETTDETVDTNKEVKTDNKPKTRKDLNLSKIFAIPEGATDGSLLASGEVPFPIGAGKDFGKQFDFYLEEYYGFNQDSRIYKQMPAYIKSNLMEDFQEQQAKDIAEIEQDSEVKTTGDMIESLDLSEVQSDVTPNLGLRDGSLIAMALPPKGTETKQQQDTEVKISKDPNNVVRMETNFKTIYALAKEVGIKFPEVVAAQFGVESQHGLKVTGTNNYLGIKARPEDIESGNFTEAETYEEIDGKMVKRMEKFKNFTSIREMLLDYKKHYNDDWFNGFTTRKGTVNVNTAEEAIIRLKENGYATDSDYVKLVTDVLNDARREPPLF